MPVEIMELVIKAKVAESGSATENDGSNTGSSVNAAALAPIEKAVKEMMEILKRKKER